MLNPGCLWGQKAFFVHRLFLKFFFREEKYEKIPVVLGWLVSAFLGFCTFLLEKFSLGPSLS